MQVRRVTQVLAGACLMALVLGIPAPPALATSTTRYVSPTGWDIKIIGGTPVLNLNCTKANRCRTIKWAVGTVASSGDTVKVAAGTYVENISIAKNLTVVGAGIGKTIVDGGAADSVFTITSNAHAQIKSLRIRNGKAAQGGGVFVGGCCTLSMTGVKLMDNTANSGGAINSYGTLTLTKVKIFRNHATSNTGGGITNFGTAKLKKVDIHDNDATSGAAIYNNAGTLVIASSAIHENWSTAGNPGIYNSGGSVKLTNTTVSNNTVAGGNYDGGAIYQSSGSTTLKYVTIAGNTQSSYGAIFSAIGSVNVSNSIIYGNGANPQCGSASIGTFTDGGYNVFADTSCGQWPGSGSVIANPQLKALAKNGGFTPTMALKSTSPAVDLVPKGRCVAKDQRGVARPRDGDGNGTRLCDAGAYEK